MVGLYKHLLAQIKFNPYSKTVCETTSQDLIPILHSFKGCLAINLLRSCSDLTYFNYPLSVTCGLPTIKFRTLQ